jgi:hypothetical protein
MKALKLTVVIACSSILIFISNNCKKIDLIDDSADKFVFNVKINDEYWGTDTLTSRISKNQISIRNSKFRFSKVCFDYWQAWYFDNENGSTYFENLTLSIMNIDSFNFTYSAVFSGSFLLSDSLITFEGKIEQAEYFPEYCEIQYKYSEVDTFSIFGQWYLAGYKEFNSTVFNHPPCLVKPDPYIEFENIDDESLRFRGVFIRNSYGGDFIISSPNTFEILSFSHTLVYNCWNFDREYETIFFETMQVGENLNYSITNNVLTLESSTNGKRYVFYKHYE